MTTLRESCRCANLDEESYLRMAKKFYRKELGMSYDQWVRELVNLGVPVNTGVAIDRQIHQMLVRAGIKPQDPIERASKQAFTLSERLGDSPHFPCYESDRAECVDEDYRDDGLVYPCDTAWYESGYESAHCLRHSHHAMSASQDSGGKKHRGRLVEPLMKLWDVNWGCGDSGASDHLHDSAFNPLLHNASRATALHRPRPAALSSQQYQGHTLPITDVLALP